MLFIIDSFRPFLSKSMATFWLGVILSSALLVNSDHGAEHLQQLHCKPKPGCTLAKCDPMPDGWSRIGGLSPPSHEYPILCQNEKDSSCCGKHLTTMEQKFEEMKSEFETDLLKLQLRLEMTEKREAEARVEIALLEREKSEIKEEVENLKKESTTIKQAAGENKNELQARIETIEKMVTQMISKQTVPQINPTDRTIGEVTTMETVASEETTTKSDGVLIEEKRYFAAVHELANVFPSDGDRLCADSGGKPADILNVVQQNAVENYLRGLIPSSRNNFYVWLSMTYITETRQLRSSSGALRSLRWAGGSPRGPSAFTAVGLQVMRDSSSSSNGIFKNPPSGTAAFGFICEI